MSITPPSGMITDCDVAAIQWASGTGRGVYFRCYCWADEEYDQIGTSCIATLPHGQDVVIWARKMVGSSADNNIRPKIVAYGSQFHLWWMSDTGAGTFLRYATIDIADLQDGPEWDVNSLLEVHVDALFDVCEARIPGKTSYFLAYKNLADGEINWSERLGPITTDWSVTVEEIPENAISVSEAAIMTDGSSEYNTWLAYDEDGQGRVRAVMRDLDLGATGTIITAMPASGTWSFYQIGLCPAIKDSAQAEGFNFALVVEARNTAQGASDYFVGGCNLASDGAVSAIHKTPNVHLISQPWYYGPDSHGVAGEKGEGVYAMLGFRTRLTGVNEDSQSYYFFANLNNYDWERYAADTVRWTPCGNMNMGTAAGRRHSAGHLSHACYGPTFSEQVKTRIPSAIIYQSAETDSGRLTLTQARVVGYPFYCEDAWLQYRDPAEDTDLRTFDTVHSRPMFTTEQVGRSMFVAGGTPQVYDGIQFVESGFSWWPEILTATPADLSGSMENDGSYGYVAVYEWYDARGQFHQSAPSPIETVTMGAAHDGVTLTLRCQNLTLKHHHGYPNSPFIAIAIYRTTDAGTTYYRAGATYSVPEAFSTSYVDLMADSTLATKALFNHQIVDGAFLPLENFQPPAASVMCQWNNRIWLRPDEDDSTLWYSKEVLPAAGSTQYAAPEFSPILTVRVDEGGEVTALCPMDHALIVFKRDAIFSVVGTPLDNNGLNGDWQFQRLSSGTGCMNPKSVVLSPVGVFFQSEKGYYLLTRQQELQYVTGSAVEDEIRAIGHIKGACLLEDRNQIRLLGENSSNETVILVYDYFHDQWAKHVLQAPSSDADDKRPVHCTTWRGYATDVPFVVLSQGNKLQIERFETSAIYDAAPRADHNSSGTNVAVPLRVTLDWLTTAEWQRVRSFSVKTRRLSDSAMRADVQYDDDGSFPATFSADDTYAWSSPAPALIKTHLSRHKCGAMRISITDEDSPALTENYSISSFALEVKPKPGLRRTSDDKRGT